MLYNIKIAKRFDPTAIATLEGFYLDEIEAFCEAKGQEGYEATVIDDETGEIVAESTLRGGMMKPDYTFTWIDEDLDPSGWEIIYGREDWDGDEYDYYGIKRPEERDEWDDLWADRAREVGAVLY